MKKLTFMLLFTTIVISCDWNFYGDKDLGGHFYYLVEPAFNSIYLAVDVDQPYQHIGPQVVEKIQELGYNKKYILVSSSKTDTLKYFLINKTLENKREYSERLKSGTNLIELDSVTFLKLKKLYEIKTKTKEQYWKENGWK